MLEEARIARERLTKWPERTARGMAAYQMGTLAAKRSDLNGGVPEYVSPTRV